MNLRTLALLAVPAVLAAAAPALTMADFEALSKQKAFKEMLERAEEIAPTQRSDTWRTLVTQAVNAELVRADDALSFADRLVGRYAFLAESKDFAAAARKPVMASANLCLATGNSCLDVLTRLARAVDDPLFALEAARTVRLNLFHYLAAPLFALAVERNAPGACEDADLRLAVMAALQAPASERYVPPAKAIAEGKCFAALREPIAAQLSGADPESHLAANVCAFMKAKGALAKVKNHPCK